MIPNITLGYQFDLSSIDVDVDERVLCSSCNEVITGGPAILVLDMISKNFLYAHDRFQCYKKYFNK